MGGKTHFIVPLASITIVFYSLLALVSGWFYRKFYLICKENSLGQLGRSNIGKFDEAKSWFFLLLMISALADIPLYIGCVVKGGPHDCEWNGTSYAIFWFLHLCAVCGYAYTIIIPCLLWSDMINRKDGKLFTSKYPPDGTKRFFQLSLLCYIGLTICNIIFGGLYYKVSNHSEYADTIFSVMCSLFEPICICSIAFGCLWSGIRLQRYVRQVKLGVKTEIRFLLQMNITMAVISSSYLARGVLILRLVTFLPKSFRSMLETSYFVWLLCTRWLPYIFCSFCLIVMMRQSGEEVAQRRKTAKPQSKNNSSDITVQLEASSADNSTRTVRPMAKRHDLALTSAMYNPHDFRASTDGNSAQNLSLLHSDADYFDDESDSSYSILSQRALEDPDTYIRTVSVSSSNPSVDMLASTPDMGHSTYNRLIPPPSNSSMFTGYSPPPNPLSHSTWAMHHNLYPSSAVNTRMAHSVSPNSTLVSSTDSGPSTSLF